MKKPLSRLLVLRQRLKSAAQMELDVAVSHLHDTKAHLDTTTIGAQARQYSGKDLQDAAYQRELAVGHLASLTELVEARRELVAEAKKEERQVELLVEKRAAQAAAQAVRREAAALDDWFRATSWQEKT